jgi:hypothetical protein
MTNSSSRGILDIQLMTVTDDKQGHHIDITNESPGFILF